MRLMLGAMTLAASLMLALSACSRQDPDTIQLGAIVSLSGPAAAYGEDNRRGLELAVKALNERGGVDGKRLVVDVQDSGGDTAQALSLARRFADDEAVLAIVGPTRTGETVAVSKALPELAIPMMSVGSTGDWRSAAGDFNPWTFRSTRVDTYLIEPLLQSARDRFGVRTVAILSTANDDYAASVLPIYKAAIAKLGLVLVAEESQMTGDTDRSAQITNIRAHNPDALIINTLSSDAPTIAAQARRAGLDSRFIGTAGFSNPSTFAMAGPKTLDGTLVGDNFFVGSSNPVVVDFVRRYRAAYNADPPAYAAYAYDGVMLIADAIRRAGPNPTREAVRKALATTAGFQGVLGELTYRGSGDAEKAAVILMIAGNQYTLVQ